MTAYQNERRARIVHATPQWADADAIRAKYEKCAIMTAVTGIRHNVDHTVPLRAKNVVGLNVEGNLQVIPEVSNQKKKNSFPSDGYREFFGPGGVYLGMEAYGKNTFEDPESPEARRWLGRDQIGS
jgi:hypothetical protein